jgi:hypothetical protein
MGHSILVAAYPILVRDRPFVDLGANDFDEGTANRCADGSTLWDSR